MQTLAIILQIILGAGFVLIGLAYSIGIAPIRERFAHGRLPQWLRFVAGGPAIVAGALILAGFAVAPLTTFGALLLAIGLLGALIVELGWIRRRAGWIAPAGLLILALGLVYLQPLGVQILAMPQVGSTVSALVPARELAVFPAGSFLESIKQDRAGNLYITRTTNFDLNPAAASAMRGEIVRLTPDGAVSTFASLPPGSLAGVLAIAADDTIYLTVNAFTSPQYHGVWRFDAAGNGTLFAPMPLESQPNGITIGPDGLLYVADSGQGFVWRVDPAGEVEVWSTDPQHGRRPWIGLYPGANGLHFWQGDLYVAVSDRGRIVRVPLQADGSAGPVSVHAEGVPTDDFAFDAEGNIYATTHAYNSVIRIRPNGQRELLAGLDEGVIGPTDVVFGLGPDDLGALYVVTDGGLFEGRADLRPAVIRLEIGRPGAVGR